MAAAMATSMALLNLNRSFITANKSRLAHSKPTKSVSLLASKLSEPAAASGVGTVIAGAIFSALATSEPEIAAQQLAEIADGDNRGLALLIPIIPAVAWVLFNILQPALNQINRMRNTKGVIVGLGLGGLAASGFFQSPAASAGEIAAIADADNRGQLLVLVVAPAIGWVLFNIFQPALNQINRMRSE